jgi:two-component system, sensor histidine kinase and response regulator
MLDRPSILVIDDEPNNFDVIEILLTRENYHLHFASSGQRALDRLDIFQPDLVLLDVMMPDLDGIEVCRRIRASSQWQVVPILMVSALSDRRGIERCMSAGANGYIVKPVSRKELVTKIANLL